jgi:hypothetical protein
VKPAFSAKAVLMERMNYWWIPCLRLTERGVSSWPDGGSGRVGDDREEIETLTALSRSRTEPASRVSRAAMLLAYRENPSFFAVARRLGAHHQTVQRCVERAVAYGALAALDDRPISRASKLPFKDEALPQVGGVLMRFFACFPHLIEGRLAPSTGSGRA